MKNRKSRIVSAIAFLVLVIAFGKTAFIGFGIGAFLALDAWGLLVFDTDESIRRAKWEKEDKEAIDMLRRAEDLEFLCRIREETQRRHLIEEWAKTR